MEGALLWYESIKVHKLYLSAILELCDRHIVSYVLSESNDNPLVYKTFDKAVKANRMPILCSTAIETSNTQAEHSATNSYGLECPVWPTALAMALWRDSGAS